MLDPSRTNSIGRKGILKTSNTSSNNSGWFIRYSLFSSIWAALSTTPDFGFNDVICKNLKCKNLGGFSILCIESVDFECF